MTSPTPPSKSLALIFYSTKVYTANDMKNDPTKIIRDTMTFAENLIDSTRGWADSYILVYHNENDVQSSEDFVDLFKEKGVMGQVEGSLEDAIDKTRNRSDYFMVLDDETDIIIKDPQFKTKLHDDVHLLRLYDSLVHIVIRYDAYIFKTSHEYVCIDMGVKAHVLCINGSRKESILDGVFFSPKNPLDVPDISLVEPFEITYEDPQSMFYLAEYYFRYGFIAKLKNFNPNWRTYFTKAKTSYKRYLDMNSSNPRCSQQMIGACMFELGENGEDVMNLYNTCFEADKFRPDALYPIIHQCRMSGEYEKGFNLGQIAFACPSLYSTDILAYKLADEMAICAYNLRNYSEAYRLWNYVFDNGAYPQKELGRLMGNLHTTIRQIGKPILCFYIGYSPNINGVNFQKNPSVYGSELALVYLAEKLAKTYGVYIFGGLNESELYHKGVYYYNSNKLENFQRENPIDTMIVYRYVNYFIDFEITARKTFMWLQDVYPLPYWNFNTIPNNGIELVRNVIDRLDGIITLSNWHRDLIAKEFGIPLNKMFVMGNCINIETFNNKVERVKNRFIYTSCPTRGVDKLVEYFPEIRKRLPDATLHIFRDPKAFKKETLEAISKTDFMFFHGKIENSKLPDEYLKSEFFFYPTNFEETYCICALEAQMAGCVCIYTDKAGLKTTIADRGLILPNTAYSEAYRKEAIDTVVRVANDEDLKREYSNKGHEWARTQSWENKAEEWTRLLNS